MIQLLHIFVKLYFSDNDKNVENILSQIVRLSSTVTQQASYLEKMSS
jgi:hypothetical protein